MSEAFRHLETARAVLEDTLALLDGDRSADAPALAELDRRLRALPDPAELRATLPAAEHEAFDDRLEELQRLNAVLVMALRRDRDAVGAELVAVRRRRTGRRVEPEPRAGARCDVSG
ncbi:MAG: hypothetical protein AAFU73_00265 [Planctomycetota bacterium]